MGIRKAQIEDAQEICSIILKVLAPTLHDDFDEEGWKVVVNSNDTKSIQDRIKSEDFLTLCFIDKNMIVGIITMHHYKQIYQLFVLPASRNMKVASKLWYSAKEICSQKGNNENYWVKSSTMAVPVYESFGFQLEGDRRIESGITYFPMSLKQ